MRLTPAVRVRIAAAVSALTVLASAAAVRAQFTPPSCVPPLCNPEVIQNIDVDTGTAQVADINIVGDGKLGYKFQVGANAPVLTQATENLYYGNVGGTSTNGSLLLLQMGAADRLRVLLTGQLQLPLGSAAAPSYSFLTDTNTGFYSSAADTIQTVTNGTTRTTVNNSGMTLNSGALSSPTGSAASPSYTFTGDGNTGMYRSAADTLNLATAGVSRLQIDATGLVTIPGALTVQGTFTASGGIGGDGSALTNLNASNITTGTLNDARLSPNVALLNRTPQTFTGNNTFSGMTSFGDQALVAGAGQNVLYGVADTTSAGNLMLLQSESGGVYTDRFRVAMNGDVTAGSFSGVGTNLTALNATQLTSGTVPSARISGTYANNLTFSGMTSFGSAARVVSAGQNLVYGNIDATSTGNLLLLQNESVDRFRVDAAGNVIAAGTITATGGLTSGGSNVCLQNGTNCPVSSVTGSGAGISVTPTTGAVVVQNTGDTNAADDLTGLSAGAGIQVTGAAPTLTITNTGDTNAADDVTGSGTTNYVARFTGSSTLGNSIIQDNGTTAAIGGTPAAGALTVVGPTSLSNALIATTNAANGVGIYGFGLGSSSVGLYGQGQGAGVYGNGAGAGGVGLQGTGNYAGVTGTTANVWGYGVLGTVPAGSYAYGVYGITGSSQYTSAGVAGINSGNGMGGYFQSNNPTTYALLAYNGGNPTTGYAFQAQGASNFTGAVSMNSNLTVGGSTTLGDASIDTLTIYAGSASIPNNLNIDSNTLYIDAANNRVGVLNNIPTATLDVNGTFRLNGSGTAATLITTAGGTGAYGYGGSVGVRGEGTSYGGLFESTTTGIGVRGNSTGSSGDGVWGTSTNGYGVYANSSNSYGSYSYSANTYGLYARGYDTGGYFTNAWGVGVHIARYGGGMYSTGYDSGGHFYDLNGTSEAWVAEGSYAFRGTGTISTTGNIVASGNTWGTGSGWFYCELDSATGGWQYCTCPNGSFVGNLAVFNPGSYAVARDIATYCYEP